MSQLLKVSSSCSVTEVKKKICFRFYSIWQSRKKCFPQKAPKFMNFPKVHSHCFRTTLYQLLHSMCESHGMFECELYKLSALQFEGLDTNSCSRRSIFGNFRKSSELESHHALYLEKVAKYIKFRIHGPIIPRAALFIKLTLIGQNCCINIS